MEITHNGKTYKLDVQRAIEDGSLKAVNKPKQGEIWRQGATDILILNNNNYHCVDYLNSGLGYSPTDISPSWIPELKFVAKNLKEYYQNL